MRALISLIVIVTMVFVLDACHSNRGWIKYSSNEDGFSVYLPETPKKSVKQEITPFGKQAVHYISWESATFDINKIKVLQVSYTDCPRRATTDSLTLNNMLDSSINIHKRNYTELEVQSERISIEGYPGRAFIYQDEKENATTVVKECLANNKLYCLTAVVKRDYPTVDELNRFFNSFLILR